MARLELSILAVVLISYHPFKGGSQETVPSTSTSQHPFLYAGEWDTRKPNEQSIFIVRGGKIVWQYSMPIKTASGRTQEFDDATMLSDGRVIFSRMSRIAKLSIRWPRKASSYPDSSARKLKIVRSPAHSASTNDAARLV